VAAFIVFYDANVLYPAELRNLLMHLALIGVFRRQVVRGRARGMDQESPDGPP